MILPTDTGPLLAALTPVFSQPTAARFAALLAAALLTTGRRTVANLRRNAPANHVADRMSVQRGVAR